jgi:MerR family transcriptional regulator, light-induced transcriptional regulator
MLGMKTHDFSATGALSIAAVERDTGLSKDTLRVWERRYGFPTPERDACGERRYAPAQLEKLRVVKRLLDGGARPCRIVALPIEALHALTTTAEVVLPDTSCGSAEPGALEQYLRAVRAHDAPLLRRTLTQAQLRLGAARFITEIVAPLNVAVGDQWLRGRLQVFEEHLYTDVVQGLLRQTIGAMPEALPAASPRVLLTTLPGEPHGLGLLMVQTLLSLEGCVCIQLGPQLPVADMLAAAAAYRADIVALSCSGCMAANDMLAALLELRGKLAPVVELWAGGSAQVLQRQRIDGVLPMAALASIAVEVRRWRDQRM